MKQLEESSIKDTKRNRLLYLMEKSMIMNRQGDLDNSRKLLLETAALSKQLYRTSLLGESASFVYNDSAADYSGEDYEKVAIHTMLAVSFLVDNQLSSAAVEARAINVQLEEINSFYKSNKNRYAEDAFARYLSGIIFEAKGEYDDAIISYRSALKTFRGNYLTYFDTPPPLQLIDNLYRLLVLRKRHDLIKQLELDYPNVIPKQQKETRGGYAEVVVIHQLGMIATKRTTEFVFTFDGRPQRLSFPVIHRGDLQWKGKSGIEVDQTKFINAEMVQNMNAIASATLEDKRLRITAKTLSRVVLKDQLAQQARKNLGLVGEIGAAVYNVVTETADTRSWTLLPASFDMTRIKLPPGEHSIVIYSSGAISRIVKITVKAGAFYFFSDMG